MEEYDEYQEESFEEIYDEELSDDDNESWNMYQELAGFDNPEEIEI
jgi:hypothetical protein